MKDFFIKIPKVIYVIFFLSIFVRLILLVALLAHGGQSSLLLEDSIDYKYLGDSLLAHHEYAINGVTEAFRGPGYPIFFLLLGWFSLPFWFGSVLQIIVASFVPVFIYFLAKKFIYLSDRFSFFAACLVIFEPIQIFYSVVLMPDLFFSIFFMLGLFFLMKWLINQNLKYAIWAGVFIGVSNYFRPAGLYFLIAVLLSFPLFMFFKKIPIRKSWHLALCVVGVVLVMMPWYVRNYVAFNEVGFVSAGAYNLYVYSAASTMSLATGDTLQHSMEFLASELKKNAPDHKNPSSFKNEEYLNHKSKEIIFAHPTAYLKSYFLGLNTFLFSGNYHYLLSKYNVIDVPKNVSFSLYFAQNGFLAGISEIMSVIINPYFFLALLGKIFWVIVVLGSIVGAWFYRKNITAFVFFLALLYFCVTILSTTLGVEARHRYMLNPLIFLFFTAMISHIYDRFVRCRTRI